MAEANSKKRFAHFSDNELREKSRKVQDVNTLKNEKKAERVFKHYLSEVGACEDFYNFTEQELDSHLCKFWFAARTQKNEEYKVGSLETLRYGLNRALKCFVHEFDITRSVQALLRALRHLKTLVLN